MAWRDAPLAAAADIERVHGAVMLAEINRLLPRHGLWNIDQDTVLSPGSMAAALRAAGAVCAAVDAVCTGEARRAFCAIRPPGHHAERDHPLAFCLLNNIAIGAARARAVHAIRRLAIVDFDAHHGNGAQNIFWADPDVLVASLHEWPNDMPTGARDETGAHGSILNIPLPAGSASAAFRTAVETILLPRLLEFQPEIIFVAAGFDAHKADKLASLCLETEDFSWISERLAGVAGQCCGGRLVASLEGGYDPVALPGCAAAFVRGMCQA